MILPIGAETKETEKFTLDENGFVVEVRKTKVKDMESNTWVTVSKSEIPTGKTLAEIDEGIDNNAAAQKARYDSLRTN